MPSWRPRSKSTPLWNGSTRFIPKLQAEGISLHYHNHDCDFAPTPEGLVPEEELLARTSILLEVDTYWTFVASRTL